MISNLCTMTFEILSYSLSAYNWVVVTAFSLHSKSRFASRKDILLNGAENTFNFLHFCMMSTSPPFLQRANHK